MIKADQYDAQFEPTKLPIIDAKSIGRSHYNPSTIAPEVVPLLPTQGESQYDTYVPREEIENPEQFYRQRGENQPWYDQAGNFLNQAVIGEVVGGTIMSLGAIAGIPEMISNAIDGTEQEFSNSLYDLGESITDWTKEITPIYQTGERFGDSGWWWSNGVSVASTLSMMLPGMGVAKGVGALGKVLKLGQTATRLASTGLGALTMRHAENFREANDVFESVYQMGIDAGRDEETSRKAASDAASLDYQANYANLAFDVIQLGAVLRPFQGLTRNVGVLSGKVGRAADAVLSEAKYTPKSVAGRIFNKIAEPAKIGLAEWTEGIEEGINTASQFEANRQGAIDLGLQKDDGSTLPQRLISYLGTAEMQDSMIWGMMGGMAFKGVAGALGFDENKGVDTRKIAEIGARGARLDHYGKILKAIKNNEVLTDSDGKALADFRKLTPEDKTQLSKDTQEEMLKDLTFTAAKAGNVDILLDQINDSKFVDTLTSMGVGTKEEISKSVPDMVKRIEQYEAIYKKHFSNFFESPISSRAKEILVDKYTDLESKLLQNNDALSKLSKDYSDLRAKDAWYQSQPNKMDVDTAIESTSLIMAKTVLEQTLEDKNLSKINRDTAKRAINNIQKRIDTVRPISAPVDISAIDKRLTGNLSEQIVVDEYNKELANTLTELTKPEAIKKEASEVNKKLDDISKAFKENKAKADAAKISEDRKKAKVEVEEATDLETETPTAAFIKPNKTEDSTTVTDEIPLDEVEGTKLLEDIKPVENETPNIAETLEFDSTPLVELLDKTDSKLSVDESIEAKKADIERRRQEELQNLSPANLSVMASDYLFTGGIGSILSSDYFIQSLMGSFTNASVLINEIRNKYSSEVNSKYGNLSDFVNSELYGNVISEIREAIKSRYANPNEALSILDEILKSPTGVNPKIGNQLANRLDGINLTAEEINAKYDAELAALPSEETVDLAKVEESIEKATYEDGNNVDVDNRAVPVEEDESIVGGESLKRNEGTAINYLVGGYTVEGKSLAKHTIDVKDVNPDALLASEWGEFGVGNKLILSLDRAFSGEVDTYDGEHRMLAEGKPIKTTKTFDELFAEDKLNSPIKIQAERDGQLVTVGYLPTLNWLSARDGNNKRENLSDTENYPADIEIEKVRKIREAIVNGELDAQYGFVVSNKGLGKLAITTERGADKKKINKPVTEAMPNYITSKYFSGTVQPFTIFNNDFLVGKDVAFGSHVAISDETKANLSENAIGGVFMMIPSAVPGVFIPTPVSTPYINENIAIALTETISAVVFGDNTKLLAKIADNYGINIDSRAKLKDYLSEFIYFTAVDNINKTLVDGRMRIAFDTKTSTIIVNHGDGRVTDKIALNTANSNSAQLEASIRKLKQSLQGTKLSIKLSRVNSTDNFSVPVIAEDDSVNFEDSTYNKFISDNIQTDLVELMTKTGTPVYVTQPVINIEQQGELISSKEKETVEVVDDEDIIVPEGFGEGFNTVDELVGVESDELIGVEQVEVIKGASSSFLVKDGDFVYNAERQRTITQTISSIVYSQLLDFDKEGKKLPVGVALANAKRKMQLQYDSTINFIAKLKPSSADAFINKEGSKVKWIGSHNNALFLKEEYERFLKPEVWVQFEKQVIQDLKNLSINVTTNGVEDFSTEELKDIKDSLDEGVVDGNDGQINKSFDDFATFQMDNKDTASWKVKIALSMIRSGKKNYLGLAEYLPFDTVFDDLQNILSNVEGTYSEYIKTLTSVVAGNEAKQYIKDVLDMLTGTKATWSLKNNFISVMQRANNSFMLVKWKRGENGWTLNVIESNRNNVINKVVESWNENFKTSGVKSGYIIEENGELKVNFVKTKELLEEIKSLKTLEEKKAFATKLFSILGIDLPQAGLEALLSNKSFREVTSNTYGLKGNFESQFGFTKEGKPNGLFSYIVSALSSVESTEDVSEDVDKLAINNPFTGENSEHSIKFLANLSAKYGLKLDTNTHRNVESKQIYDYSFYTPERLRIEDINKNPNIRAELGKVPFVNSRYLQMINQGKTINYQLVDGMSQVQSSRKGITRSSMSGREQLLLAISHFQKHKTNAAYIGLTHSDKSITPIIEFEKLVFDLNLPADFDGTLTLEMLPRAVRDNIKSLVLAEVARIGALHSRKEAGATREELGDQYFDGGELFYFFPELNDVIATNPEMINSIDALTTVALNSVVETVNNTVNEFYKSEIVYQNPDIKSDKNWFVAFTESYVKDKGYGRDKDKTGLSKSEALRMAVIAAADLDINYMIHNANMMMLVHGDPALEFKKDVETTLIEYQKRLAKDVAPGALGHYEWNVSSEANSYFGKPDYQVIFTNDIVNPTETEGYIKSIPSYNKKIDRTDAQEWTTVEEHINVLMSYGRIPDVMFASMMDKITAAKEKGTYDYSFTEEEMAVILQPMKPVQVMSIFFEGKEESYYIKSSSYPLIPSLTKGLDLDKIRIAMERDGVDRVAFKTAVKIGHKKLVTIADANGNILDNLSFANNKVQLHRTGFSIQQDVPYEAGKHRIVMISQMNKLLFEGIADLEFEYKGKKISGLELKKEKESIRTKLFELSAGELYSRMGIVMEDNKPVIKDFSKLLTSIKEEAESRGWAINDVEGLTIDKDGNFVVPISFNNSATRIESLILSMFTNTIIKQKINGKSMVQGTSSGFKNNTKTLDEIKDASGIVFIKDKFNPAKGLTYLEPGTDNRAQVLIPWKFAGKLEDFITDGYLDLDKVDPEVLKLIGARIPNQGHSSQLAIEVVGFLPQSMGDLVIVPGEITKQMGADFDVDKLYTYIYNNVISDNGNLVVVPDLLDSDLNLSDSKYKKFITKHYADRINNRQKLKYYTEGKIEEYNKIGGLLADIFEQDLDTPVNELVRKEVLQELGLTESDLEMPSRRDLHRASLENAYIKIHNVVLTQEDVAKKCLQPLDKKDLETTGKVGRTRQSSGNFLTVRRQLSDYSRQKAGKDGVGVMSRAVVGATVIQDYNLRLASYSKEDKTVMDTPFRGFAITNAKGEKIILDLVKLSGNASSSFLGEVRSKIDNLITQQSGAVDNAKTPVLDMNNLNMATFNVSIVMSLLQTEGNNALDLEYNSYFLKQEIIEDFVAEIANLSDTLNEKFVEDRKQTVIDALTTKYLQRAGVMSYESTGEAFTSAELKKLLEEEITNTPDYVKAQIEILNHFIKLDAIGQELSEIFTAISTDSKGLGKSYWDSSLREEQVDNLGNKSLISNAEELVQDNENGSIAKYVKEANIVMGQIFPYKTETVKNVIDEIELLSGKVDGKVDVDFRQAIWNDIKRYIVRNIELDLYGNREELFYGENSLAKRVDKAKAGWGSTNLFISKLRTVKATKAGNPDLVTFAASFGERTDEADVIKAFTDLFISPNDEIRQFAEDLVKYSYTTGGVQQALEFVKYVPTAYLASTNFGKLIKETLDTLHSLEDSKVNPNIFVKQFIQHNPQNAKKLIKEPKTAGTVTLNVKDDAGMLISKRTPDGIKKEFPRFVVYRNTKDNIWQLYEFAGFEGNNSIFNRISLLGGKGKDLTSYNEYEFNNNNVVSTMPKNRKGVTNKTVKSTSAIPKTDPNEVEIPNPASVEVNVSRYLSAGTGVSAVQSLVNSLVTDRFKQLGKFLAESGLAVNPNLTIKTDSNLKSLKTGESSRGKYTNGGELVINPRVIKKFNSLIGNENFTESIEAAFMHELLHAYTSEQYSLYLQEKATPEVTRAFKKIKVLRELAYQKLTPEEQVIVTTMATGNMKLISSDDKERAKLIERYYGFTSDKEFISEAFSNPVFQGVINEIQFNNTKTIIQRFFDLIKSIFPNVKSNSVLEATLDEVLTMIDTISNERLQEVSGIKKTPTKNVTLLDSNYPYTKTTAVENKDTHFIFTENAEAYLFSNNMRNEINSKEFPYYPNNPKINVTASNNQAGIRTDNSGNINRNAVGIVVKKYQQDKNGVFVKQDGGFKDTTDDFNLFVALNNNAFSRLQKTTKIVVPKQFALGKAALPKRFAEWLQSKLLNELGVITDIKENNTSGYSGYGLEVSGLQKDSNERLSEVTTTEITGFQGYKGGFENTGKGTPEGDGKDKAMRQVADGFIGEVVNVPEIDWDNLTLKERSKSNSSSLTSYIEASSEDNQNWTVKNALVSLPTKGIIMLARNSEFKGKPLESGTRAAIKSGVQNDSEFIVGDMPNVDSQFIDYLQEIGARFTIYHTGNVSRIKVEQSTKEKLDPSTDKFETSLLIGVETLGTTVGEFMKDLTKEERTVLRKLVSNKEIIFKCR